MGLAIANTGTNIALFVPGALILPVLGTNNVIFVPTGLLFDKKNFWKFKKEQYLCSPV